MYGPMRNMHRSERFHSQRLPFVRAFEVVIRRIISIEHYFWCKLKQRPNYGHESMKVILVFCMVSTWIDLDLCVCVGVFLFVCTFYCRKIALETLFQLCDWDIFRRVRNWDILERYVDEEDQIEAFNSIATDIDENAKYCAWHRRTSCDEYFRPIITNEGRCFTFVIPFLLNPDFSHFFPPAQHIPLSLHFVCSFFGIFSEFAEFIWNIHKKVSSFSIYFHQII